VRRLRAGALAFALSAAAARAGAAVEVADLLQPGSHSAVGLGGDPFLSPLDDRTGWWSEPDFTRDPNWRLDELASEPLAQDLGSSGSKVSNRDRVFGASGGLRWAQREWLISARLSRPRWEGSWQGAAGGLRLAGGGTRLDAGLRVEGVLPGVTAQLRAPLWHSDGSVDGASGMGLRYRGGSRLLAQGAWTRSRLPEALESDLYGIPLVASTNLGSEQLRLDARVRLFAGLVTEGSVGSTRYGQLAGRQALATYQIMPRGENRLDQGSLLWSGARGPGLIARWTRFGLDVEGDACWGGQRFGRLDYGEVEMRSLLLGARSQAGEGTHWLLDFEQVQAEGRARAVLESWPFTPSVVDFLGLRRIYRAVGRARWHRGHVGLERGLGARVHGQVGANWYDIRPEGTLDSWRPAFLVFGRVDASRDVLRIARAQLAALSLGCRLELGRTDASLQVRQFFFAKTWERPADIGEGNDTPSGAHPNSPGRGRGWPGGTQIQIALARGF
jgi:hypothetical protein